jgi:hypothetical protein
MRRATVRFQLAGKTRIGVVINVRDKLVEVAYGTSEEHVDWPQLVVHPETRQGRTLMLREVTYFYGANTSWEQPSDLQFGEPCAKDLFYAIAKLCRAYREQLGEQGSDEE